MDDCQQAYGLPSAIHGLSHGLKIARQLSIFAPVCALVPPFQVLCPTEKSDSKSYRTFLAGALGLEFQVSGIYGVFETFVFLKHHFHPIYSIIFNCSFCVFPLKGNRKGKNMGNKQVLTTPQYTRVWASQLINRDAHKKGGRRILCNFTEIRSYQA